MKKLYIFIVFLLLPLNVFASSGKLNKNTVLICNGEYYGSHASDNHYHKALLDKDGNYYATGEIVNSSIINSQCKTVFNEEKTLVTLNKCVDGDTAKFNIQGSVETARFLAIDTKESVHPTKSAEEMGYKASDYTCDKLTKANKIELEYDLNSSSKDKYGRILVWVFIDGELFQDNLVKNGYASVAYLYGNYKYTDTLKTSEEYAKEKKLGIWSNTEDTNIYYVILGTVVSIVIISLKKYLKIKKRGKK